MSIGIDLAGRTALVTGSSGGIGFAIGVRLAEAGAAVILNGRTPESVDAAVSRASTKLGQGEAQVRGAVADASTPQGAESLLEQAGPVDVLVNNLGIYGAQPGLEISDDDWRRYFEVNVLSAARLIRELLPGMIERGWGRVLNIASDSAVVIPEEMIHYGMSKTALLALSRGYAKLTAGTGVTVNSVIVGPTHTPGVEDFVREMVPGDLPWDDAEREFMRTARPQSLLQRLIEPEEIANLVTYLSSPLASATTGAAVRVDGGYVDAILP